MQAGILRLGAVLGASTVLFSGCQPLTPEETTGPYSGANANAAAAGINRAGTSASGGLYATGAPTAAINVAVTTVIAKHQASVRQRQIALERARASYKKIVAAQANAAPSHTGTKGHTGTKPAAGGQNVASNLPGPKRVPRYIAVDTEKDAKTAPGAKKAVMIFDTQAQDIVGNNVYDIANSPAVGTTSRFETYAAEYVGAGL